MIYRFGGLALAISLAVAIAIGVGYVEKQRAARLALLAQNQAADERPQTAPPQVPVEVEQATAAVAAELAAREQSAATDLTATDLTATGLTANEQGAVSEEPASEEASAANPSLPEDSATMQEPEVEDMAGNPTPAEPEFEQLIDMLETSSANLAVTPIVSTEVSVSQSCEENSQPQEVTANKPVPEPELDWYEDYRDAHRQASDEGRMLLIYFYDRQWTPMRTWFEQQVLTDGGIKDKLAEYVLLRLPVDASISLEGRPTPLLRHASFSEMQGRSGIAIIDLAHRKETYYKYVVSTFPFTRGRYYRGPVISAILSLPPGTLTQRTMIYAVRTHPERPASTQGNFHNVLAEEAKLQSDYQARILVQGHHNWDSRFHRINSRLPGGATAQEVVAESWPNENLLDACVDCVDSWRQSPGHWSAVRSRHPLFGFDIKRGRNGIWYATGIFGRR